MFPSSAYYSVFLPRSHIHLLQPNFSSDLLSSHPQSHWKCLPLFLAVSLLAPLSYLSRFLLVSFFLFPLSLVYFLCLAFVSLPLEIENFLFSLPHGSFQHKVESWTAVSKSVFDMIHWSSIAGTTLINHLRCAVYGQEFKFSAMSLYQICAELGWTVILPRFLVQTKSVKIKVSCCWHIWSECMKASTSQRDSLIILVKIKHLSLPVFLKWQCVDKSSIKNFVQASSCHENISQVVDVMRK